MARIDATGLVTETDETDNTMLFEGGVFFDSTNGVVHVHGTDDYADQIAVGLDVGYVTATIGGYGFGYLSAAVSAIHIFGHDGNDTISPSSAVAASTWQFGGDGDDSLRSSGGNDYLVGAAGNDIYYFANASGGWDLGDDVIVEECVVGDEDTLSFVSFTPGGGQGIEIDLGDTDAQDVAAYLGLTLSDDDGIERVFGTAYDDLIRGNTLDNYLSGGYGDDTYRFANTSGRYDLAARPITLALAA